MEAGRKLYHYLAFGGGSVDEPGVNSVAAELTAGQNFAGRYGEAHRI